MSREKSLNVFMAVCPICLNETGVAIDPVFKAKSDDSGVKYIYDRQPCDKCNKHIKNGYTALIEVSNKNKDVNFMNAERTGRLVFVKKEALNGLHPVAFCEIGTIDKIVERYKKNTGEEPKCAD